jgi:hypothetical protein
MNKKVILAGIGLATGAVILLARRSSAANQTGAVVLQVTPSTAKGLLNGTIPIGLGKNSNIPVGTYSWSVSAAGYVTKTGPITVVAGKESTINITLEETTNPPGSGTLAITRNPSNLQLRLDGIIITANNIPLYEGTHTWAASLDGYTPQNGVVTIVAGQTFNLDITLVKTVENPITYAATCGIEILENEVPLPYPPEYQLLAGKSYTARFTVKNQSTRDGSPVAAHFSVNTNFVITPVSGADITILTGSTSGMDCGTGETKTHTRTFTIPSNVGYADGSVQLKVRSPANVSLAWAYGYVDVLTTGLSGWISSGLVWTDDYEYWQDVAHYLPDPVPITTGKEVYLAIYPMNGSTVPSAATGQVTVTKPSGSKVTLTGTSGEMQPGEGGNITFDPFVADLDGEYTIAISMIMGGNPVDTAQFKIAAAPGNNGGSTASLEVLVRDGITMAPIADAVVILGEKYLYTGADGVALFEGLVLGERYSILVSAPGYAMYPENTYLVEAEYWRWIFNMF